MVSGGHLLVSKRSVSGLCMVSEWSVGGQWLTNPDLALGESEGKIEKN